MQSPITVEGLQAMVTVNNAMCLLALWLVYRVLLVLYNMSPLHPLHKFPGPKLAAASFLYEAWYDLVRGGKYSWKIKSLHEQYGICLTMSQERVICYLLTSFRTYRSHQPGRASLR